MRCPEDDDRIGEYLRRKGGSPHIVSYLGGGTDGQVWSTSDRLAIKVFDRFSGYANERDTYQRLAEYGYGLDRTLGPFHVPEMHDHHDDLMIVAMDIMQKPPYVLDFAKVRLNSPPDFPADVLEQLDRDGRDQIRRELASRPGAVVGAGVDADLLPRPAPREHRLPRHALVALVDAVSGEIHRRNRLRRRDGAAGERPYSARKGGDAPILPAKQPLARWRIRRLNCADALPAAC